MEVCFLLARTRWDRIARVPWTFLAESGDYIPEWSLPLAGWPMICLLNSLKNVQLWATNSLTGI